MASAAIFSHTCETLHAYAEIEVDRVLLPTQRALHSRTVPA